MRAHEPTPRDIKNKEMKKNKGKREITGEYVIRGSSGKVVYYNEKNEISRKSGPAITGALDGTEEFWLDGKRHRIGGPAIVRW